MEPLRAMATLNFRLLTVVLGAWMAACACVLVAGCGDRTAPPSPPAPSGGEVRIAVLSPAAAVMLRDIGQEHRIVARHAFDLVLSRDLPVGGDQNTIDLEALLRARPTHVITQWQSRSLPGPFAETAARQGWKVHEASLLSVDDIDRELAALRDFLSLPVDESADHMRLRLRDALKPRGPGGGPFRNVGRVLLLGATEPAAALGPGSCHQQVLERIGGAPALLTGNAWVELSTEDLLRLRPDAIVAVLPRERRQGDERTSYLVRGEEAAGRLRGVMAVDIPAVRRGRIAVIDDPLALLPSTSVAGFADELADILMDWEAE
jgi:ABC-type hemin transport system substrate-binding protein